MRFEQPNNRARVMHQIVDRLIEGASVTLTFGTETEARHGLAALNEVAQSRQIGIVVEPCGQRKVQIRLIEPTAA